MRTFVAVLIAVITLGAVGAARAQEQEEAPAAQPGYYVLDGWGGVHAGNGAPVYPPTPYFGFDIARDVKPMPGGYYVLDGFGGIHKTGLIPALFGKYWRDDVFEDIELVKVRCECAEWSTGGGGECRRQVSYVRAIALDALGGVWQVSSKPSEAMILWTPNDGPWDHPGIPYSMHVSIADGDETPFLGFDAARDVELAGGPWSAWQAECALVR